jgi:ElaB/YqjD/DUF883 family membrane-anchored ribosome-binding protein
MDQESSARGTEQLTGESRDPEQIQAEIRETREELGDTVEALAHKTDVKARAKDKAETVKESVKERAGSMKAASPSGVGAAADQATQAARNNPIAAAAIGAFALGFVIGRRRRRR